MKLYQSYRFCLWLLILACLPMSPADAVKTQNFTFDYELDGNHQEVVLNVEHQPQGLEITYFNEFGDMEISWFKDPLHPLNTQYFDPERQLVSSSTYDYEEGKLIIEGAVNARYSLTGLVFDNNGALFYLFSIFYPEEQQAIFFKLVQSNLSRVPDPFLRFLISQLVGPVPMVLKYIKRETLEFQSTQVEADCYELSVSDPTLAVFWPYKYYFWYSVRNRRLVKHQGMSAEKLQNYYLLTNYFEWEHKQKTPRIR